jgi:undecaprenyl-diphosphatase
MQVLGAVWNHVLVPFGRMFEKPRRFLAERLEPGERGLDLTTLTAFFAVGMGVFLVFAISIADGHHPSVDHSAAVIARHLYWKPVKDVVAIFTNLGSLAVVGPVVVLTAGWAWVKRRRLAACALLVGLGLTGAIVEIVKITEDRARPVHPYASVDGASFPSGHAAWAVALVACAVVFTRSTKNMSIRIGVISATVVLTLLIALSRIYLRAHFFSDILGGIGISTAIFSLCGIVALMTPVLLARRRTAHE